MHDGSDMHLTVLRPDQIVFSGPVQRVVARGPHGAFGLLPRHADCACPLTTGLVTVETPEQTERFFGIDEGILVKCGPVVRIAAHRVFVADTLEQVRDGVETAFAELDDRERAARTALGRLEASVARQFADLDRQQ